MDIVLGPLLVVLIVALDIYWWIVIAMVIFGWLVAFGIINTYSHVVRVIGDVLARLTEPALRPIRRFMPDVGPVDLSPIVLFLLILFLKMVLQKLAMQL